MNDLVTSSNSNSILREQNWNTLARNLLIREMKVCIAVCWWGVVVFIELRAFQPSYMAKETPKVERSMNDQQ